MQITSNLAIPLMYILSYKRFICLSNINKEETKIIIRPHLINQLKMGWKIKITLLFSLPQSKHLKIKTIVYFLFYMDGKPDMNLDGGRLKIRCWEKYLTLRDITLHNFDFQTFYHSPNIIRMIKSEIWISHEEINWPRRRQKYYTKVDLKFLGRESADELNNY